jgi:osmotically inducible protein OsmC
MPTRTADAHWVGTSREGQGTIKLGSGAFEGKYSWNARFEEAPGTNPEELIAAAHAGCFSMALASGLTKAGFPPQSINTTAQVHFNKVGDGFKITAIHLQTEANVPNIGSEQFQQYAETAKNTCPISQALAAVETITLTAKLV